jgi:hypothetical protein
MQARLTLFSSPHSESATLSAAVSHVKFRADPESLSVSKGEDVILQNEPKLGSLKNESKGLYLFAVALTNWVRFVFLLCSRSDHFGLYQNFRKRRPNKGQHPLAVVS